MFEEYDTSKTNGAIVSMAVQELDDVRYTFIIDKDGGLRIEGSDWRTLNAGISLRKIDIPAFIIFSTKSSRKVRTEFDCKKA